MVLSKPRVLTTEGNFETLEHDGESGVSETYEVLESIGGQVEMGHERKEPNNRVGTSLSETNPNTGVSFLLDSIRGNAAVCENPLLRGKPSGGQGRVWKAEEPDNGNDEGNCSLEDEQPLPTSKTGQIIHTMENASCDESCKGCS